MRKIGLAVMTLAVASVVTAAPNAQKPNLEMRIEVFEVSGAQVQQLQSLLPVVPAPQVAAMGAILKREYDVPPGLLPAAETRSGQGGRWWDAKPFFEARGVPFPNGASASFMKQQQKLVVKNTAENLAKLEEIIAGKNVAAPRNEAQDQGQGMDKALQAFRGMGTPKKLFSKTVVCASGAEFRETAQSGKYSVQVQGTPQLRSADKGMQLKAQAQIARAGGDASVQGDAFLAQTRSCLMVGNPAPAAPDKAGSGSVGYIMVVTFNRVSP